MSKSRAEARFDHVGFITPSIERSVEFWTKVMGFEAQPVGTRRQEWVSTFMGVPGADVELVHLFGLGTHIEFIEFKCPVGEPVNPAANQPSVAHICLRVPDVEDWRARMLAGGGGLQGELVAITEGVAKGLRGLYMRDPHGIMIELVELPR
ncbi:VOC family protein [Chelativorans alearense]|uniref:VOC family protein n=1 Tax=Chelativorans alearense TaxID=2681495 RepID=UPI0013D19498|nr:VOC family protein [Chelativorans alearense]